MTLVPEVLQLSVNSGKKSEQSFFYFKIYFFTAIFIKCRSKQQFLS